VAAAVMFVVVVVDVFVVAVVVAADFCYVVDLRYQDQRTASVCITLLCGCLQLYTKNKLYISVIVITLVVNINKWDKKQKIVVTVTK
jgi:hypothetical protein